jgi:hypothetical protein
MLSAKEAKSLTEENKVKIKLETEKLVSKLVVLLEEEIIDTVEEGKLYVTVSYDRAVAEYPEVADIMRCVWQYNGKDEKYGYGVVIYMDDRRVDLNWA